VRAVLEERLLKWAPIAGLLLACCAHSLNRGGLGGSYGSVLVLVGDLAWLGAGATMVVLGIRSVRRHGPSVRVGSAALLGVLILGCSVAFPLTLRGLLTSSADFWSEELDPRVEEVALPLSQDLSVELWRRAFASRIRASEHFVKRGEIVDALTAGGEMRRYVPSDEERELRQETLKARAIIMQAIPSLRRAAWTGMLVLVVSLVAGLSTPLAPIAAQQGNEADVE
jgi:hypothetical protein